jgi:hypothetical protein
MDGPSSTSAPVIPPELSSLYTDVADEMRQGMIDMPLSNYYSMQPRQYSDMSGMEQWAANLIPGLTGSPALNDAYGVAQSMGNMPYWSGVNLGNVNPLMPGETPYPPTPNYSVTEGFSPYQRWGDPSDSGIQGYQQRGYNQGDRGGFTQWQPGLIQPIGQQQQPQPQQGQQPSRSEAQSGNKSFTQGSSGHKKPLNQDVPPSGNDIEGEGDFYNGDATVNIDHGYKPLTDPYGGQGVPLTQYGYTGSGYQFNPGQGGGQLSPSRMNPQMPAGMGTGPQQYQLPERVGGMGEYGIGGGVNKSDLDQARIGRWDENLSFENNPAMQAAQEYFNTFGSQDIDNELSAMGLSRSGAGADVKNRGRVQAMLPITQQIMNLEAQNKGMDVQQRGQDLSSLLQAGQQGLSARGQDLSQRGQDISGGLQSRGQNINALLQQGQQALTARGQNLQGQQASLSGLLGVNQADLGRQLAAINAATGLGGTQRSIEDANYGSMHEELMRQYGLADRFVTAPFGQATSMIGQETTSNGK